MRRYLYLSTAVAGVMMTAGAGASFAQCVATQNCTELGYTETSCPDGTGIKCPFGDTFACTGGSSEITPEQCTQLGFTHTCTGTGYSGGSSTACGGKYAICSCASGYEWKNGACQKKQPDYVGCVIGTLFYSDNTCSSNKVSSKTILGVVIMEKTASTSGWIMAINPVYATSEWSTVTYDIPKLTNYDSTPTDTKASCTNTNVIIATGDSSRYPAAWEAKDYYTRDTPSGKSWCLPSGGLLNEALNNEANLYRINAGISIAGGKKIGFGCSYEEEEHVWSSSEHSNTYAWTFSAFQSGQFYMGKKHKGLSYCESVRPVLAF